jgi:hypothetical protein
MYSSAFNGKLYIIAEESGREILYEKYEREENSVAEPISLNPDPDPGL